MILLCSNSKIHAYDLEANGFCYNIVSFENLTCEVACLSSSNQNTNISIGGEFEYNGRTLKVIGIADDALNNCTYLKNITLLSPLEYIGKNAFKGCNNLRQITIPQSLKLVKSDAFYGCNLERVMVNDIEAWCQIEFNKVSVPASITRIAPYIFCIGTIKSVTLHNNLTEIADYAFYYCVSLESINIPTSCQKIGEKAFYGCKSLSYLCVPPSVNSIGYYAFNGCNMDSIKIEWAENPIELDVEAFDCDLLDIQREFEFSSKYIISPSRNRVGTVAQVRIGSKLSKLPAGAFRRVKSLKKVVFEDSEERISAPYTSWDTTYDTWGGYQTYTIYETTFNGTSLEEVYLGRNVVKGGGYDHYPFDYCDAIKSITIGDCVTDVTHVTGILELDLLSIDIGKGLTHVPRRLSVSGKIILRNENPPTAAGCTNETYLHCPLYVPKGCVEKYQSADIWKNFWYILEIGSETTTGLENVNTGRKEIVRYNLKGQRVDALETGVNIIKMNDGTVRKVFVK